VRSFEPSFAQTAFLSCAVVVSAWFPHVSSGIPAYGPFDTLGLPLFVFVIAVLWLLASNAARYREPGGRMETLGAELIIVAYVGVLVCLTAELRWVAGAQAGYLVLGSLIIAAKCGDIEPIRWVACSVAARWPHASVLEKRGREPWARSSVLRWARGSGSGGLPLILTLDGQAVRQFGRSCTVL
jgi:hypothetical protein